MTATKLDAAGLEGKYKSAARIASELTAFFPASEIHFFPRFGESAKRRDGRPPESALAIPFITARQVMDRLDAVCGMDGWRDEYIEVAPSASTNGNNPSVRFVRCRLSVRFGEHWVTKEDAGCEGNDVLDFGDRGKAAYSDALKRAAVKFGIGRYLANFEKQWLSWDAKKRCFAEQPVVPAWAVPGNEAKSKSARPTELVEVLPQKTPQPPPKPPLEKQPPKAAPPKATAPAPAGNPPPSVPAAPQVTNSNELMRWLIQLQGELVRKQLCKPKELLNAVKDIGAKERKYSRDLLAWPKEGFAYGMKIARDFERKKMEQAASETVVS